MAVVVVVAGSTKVVRNPFFLFFVVFGLSSFWVICAWFGAYRGGSGLCLPSGTALLYPTHTRTFVCRKEASIVRTHASIVCVCLVAQISLDSAAAGLEESEPLKESPPPPLRLVHLLKSPSYTQHARQCLAGGD